MALLEARNRAVMGAIGTKKFVGYLDIYRTLGQCDFTAGSRLPAESAPLAPSAAGWEGSLQRSACLAASRERLRRPRRRSPPARARDAARRSIARSANRGPAPAASS